MANIAALLLFVSAQAAAPTNPSVQVLFDKAAEAAGSGDWSGAIAGYEALEVRLQAKGSVRSLAIVKVRKGEALLRLSRLEEAEIALRSGLHALPVGDESLGVDRVLAMLNLGEIAELSLRYSEAQVRYAEAERSTANEALRLRAMAGLVRTQMFEDPVAALAVADRALAIITAMPDATKPSIGRWRTLKGRALLNAGDFSAARKELALAMKELGGLTMKVDQADISARSDMAIAAMLAGDKEEARRYLAYTGAGRLKDDGLGVGVDLAPPECGGPAGLQPEDVAVVEFSIRDDGSITRVAPIYSSRKGGSAVEFARAVRTWSWSPEKVKHIDPFFRALTRLEMRCSVETSRPSVMTILDGHTRAWMKDRGIEDYVPPAKSSAANVAPGLTELARREAAFGAQSLQLLPILVQVATNPTFPDDEALELLARAETIVRAHGGPAPMLAALAIHRSDARLSSSNGSLQSSARRAELLLAALRDPTVENDAFSSTTLKIAAADSLNQARRRDRALALLRQVASDSRLGPHDPLHVGALIRIAALEKAAGDLAAARATFEQTGLSGAQCALVDAKPAMMRSNISSADFPDEAASWGFEGWAVNEFDITPDGKPVNVRSVMAYPPFVFSPAARAAVSGFRYSQSYRPDGALGCGAKRETIRFKLVQQ